MLICKIRQLQNKETALPLFQVPYFWAGIKAYDLVSGDLCLKSSYYLNKERALELFPMLKSDKENKRLSVKYRMDQFNNSASINVYIILEICFFDQTAVR